MHAAIEAIEFMLPARSETTDDLEQRRPDWSSAKLAERTGVHARRLATEDECVSDLAVSAARKLFDERGYTTSDFDFVLLCTQTPDYMLPTTACLVQERLGLPKTVGALDINLGCSGYIYALGLAKGLIESGQATRVLLITADTYAKLAHEDDKSVRSLFADGAAATAVGGSPTEAIGPFLYGTDGSGAEELIVPMGGMREPFGCEQPPEITDRHGNTRSARNIYMNGKAIVNFSLREVPPAVHGLCDKAGIGLDDVDAIVPHQASAKVLDGVRRKLEVDEDRFLVYMRDIGNTVSSSIPIALACAHADGRLKPGARLMLVGFGVGLSWGATLIRWPDD